MATTTRTPSEWRHGTAGTGTIPSDNVMMGGNWYARNKFSGVSPLSGIGDITGLSLSFIPATGTDNSGSLYVSTSELTLNNTIPTYGTLIGTWSFPASTVGTAITIPIGSFNGAAFMTAIGSATTWYCYWTRPSTGERGMVKYYNHPVFTFTHQPEKVNVYANGGWQSGKPYVWNGSSWVEGKAYVWNGTQWKPGL